MRGRLSGTYRCHEWEMANHNSAPPPPTSACLPHGDHSNLPKALHFRNHLGRPCPLAQEGSRLTAHPMDEKPRAKTQRLEPRPAGLRPPSPHTQNPSFSLSPGSSRFPAFPGEGSFLWLGPLVASSELDSRIASAGLLVECSSSHEPSLDCCMGGGRLL